MHFDGVVTMKGALCPRVQGGVHSLMDNWDFFSFLFFCVNYPPNINIFFIAALSAVVQGSIKQPFLFELKKN